MHDFTSRVLHVHWGMLPRTTADIWAFLSCLCVYPSRHGLSIYLVEFQLNKSPF